jgi:hypothetical protein
MRFLFVLALAAGCGGSPGNVPSNGDASVTGPDADGGSTTTAALSWNMPATYTDGTPLVVVGYHLYDGTASHAYGMPIDVKGATSYVFSAPAPGTYYFAVTAYDSSGSESVPSDEVSKVLK